MFSLRQTLVGLGLLLSIATFADVGTQSASNGCVGFQCVPKCPAAPAGFQYLDVDCDCDKDQRAGTCTPSGECKKYDLRGRPVQPEVTVACLCDKISTCDADSTSRETYQTSRGEGSSTSFDLD